MIPGIPGGRQLAVSLSSRPLARSASLLAAYSGVSDGPEFGASPRDAPAAPPNGTSQTPVKSGSLARAAQSAAAGARLVGFWATATEAIAAEASTTSPNRKRMFRLLLMMHSPGRIRGQTYKPPNYKE